MKVDTGRGISSSLSLLSLLPSSLPPSLQRIRTEQLAVHQTRCGPLGTPERERARPVLFELHSHRASRSPHKLAVPHGNPASAMKTEDRKLGGGGSAMQRQIGRCRSGQRGWCLFWELREALAQGARC